VRSSTNLRTDPVSRSNTKSARTPGFAPETN
jgi:hypothetical protein